MSDYDYLFKILLIGDSGIGKSKLLIRYTDDSYNDSCISTIGVDFKIKTEMVDGKNVKLQIWDTAGQERFRTITSSYYRGSNAIILVFDLSDYSTFLNLEFWLNEIRQNIQNIPILLVGTKNDLKPHKDLTNDKINKFAQDNNFKYFECSSKSGFNVNQVFIHLCSHLVRIKRNIMINDNPMLNSIVLKRAEPIKEKSYWCCYN